MYKMKAEFGLSNTGFDNFMRVFRNMLPDENSFPESLSTVKKTLKDFDLGYEKIDACINDCCLYRGSEYENLQKCPKCNASRYKVNPHTGKIKEGVAAKVLRYFPIFPRLQRMFLSATVAEKLTWHSTHHSQDGKMRHPVDSICWSTVDIKWPSFASDPRNLRFGLSTDGFNPFGNLSSKHSLWPVILVIYNLPPNICMSSEYLMLSLLIPGPKQPVNDIDIYLQPLIDDLGKLWEGVLMYDAFTKATFNLRGMLLWTINDFPAYGNLSGLTTKGEFACPICGPDTCSRWLPLAKKTIYMDTRRFLSSNHRFRFKHKWFNGRKERRVRPKIFTGRATVHALVGFINKWGKKKGTLKKLKRGDPAKLLKKKSIFFDLPYWEELPVRHNSDVMHIEKNVCESVLETILDVKGKSKVGAACRRDLELQELLEDVSVEEKKNMLDVSQPYTLTKPEKRKFLWRLWMQRFPDGYCSNIGNCIKMNESKIIGLKSRDHHVLMQQLLSIAVKGLLPVGIRKAIFRLSSFFHELCQRVLDQKRLEEMEDEIVETLCLFERYFPPSFFDIMIHLTIHIGREAKLCGPVHYRWMYPFERYMKVLKGYVKNRAAPEGSIAENYLADECVRFCGRYMKHSFVFSSKRKRNDVVNDDTIIEGSTLLKGRSVKLSDELSGSIVNVVEARRTKTETIRLLGLLRPAYVPQKEWDAFVVERYSERWKEKSDKMKAIRSRQLLPHTLSRKGYARKEYEHKMETGESLCRTRLFIKGHEKSKNEHVKAKCAEMQTKLDEQPPSEGPVPVKWDVLTQVLGKEKNGRVRGLGAGVTPSRIDAQLQSSSWKQVLEEKLEANCARTKILEDFVFNLSQSATIPGGSGNGCRGDGGSKRTSSPDKAQDVPHNGEERINHSPMTGNSKSVQGSTLGVSQRCVLLDWEGTDEIVARGKISAVDPTSKVHGYKLGPDCYRIDIEEAVNPRAEFYRSQPEFSAMEDAVGSTIMWPIKYIIPRT